jgi:transitional endoplasmic reticulum ATPase
MPLHHVDVKALAARTEGYVGADLENLCREAAMIALREDKDAIKVEMRHFETALKVIKPSTDKDVMKSYENIGKILVRASSGREDLGMYR